MLRHIECAGCPRDLGLDQGEVCRERIRTELARDGRGARGGLRVPLGSPRSKLARQLERHHPHIWERASGLAHAARVQPERLARRVESASPEGSGLLGPGLLLAAGAERTGGAAVGVRGWTLGGRSLAGLVLRRSRPDHGFASLELALAWWASPLAGVNEAGLAGTLAPGLERSGSGETLALALLEESLRLFDRAEKAADWCRRAPCGPTGTLVFADAAGGIVEVGPDGSPFRVRTGTAGVLASAARADEIRALEKGVPATGTLDVAALDAAVGAKLGSAFGAGDGERATPPVVLTFDTARRSLGVRLHGAAATKPDVALL